MLDDSRWELNAIQSSLAVFPDIEVVGGAELAKEAVVQIVTIRPDVAVIDKILPNDSMDGIGVIEHVRRRFKSLALPMPKCILYSNSAPPRPTALEPHGDLWLAPCVLAGTSGYMQKGTSAALADLIRDVHAGRERFEGFAPGEIQRIRLETKPIILTPAEWEVYRLRCAGHDTGKIAMARHTSVSTIHHQLDSGAKSNGYTSPIDLVNRMREEQYFRRAGSQMWSEE